MRPTPRSRWRRAGLSALLVAGLGVAVGTVGAGPAVAEDPPFVGWTAALPPLVGQYDPSSADECRSGAIGCVRRTVHEMERRFDPLAATCSHRAVFAHAYLRTTEAYLETARTDGFYAEPTFVNHEDAAFAEMYFQAYDDWESGRVERVPPAWRTAFGAADRREVSGTGDLLLGMNAHVNRDLPFVLAAAGLVAPDGTSRKADHDRIDVMLNGVVEPLVAEQAARFDPTMAVPWTPYGLGYTGLMQTLQVWREAAWRNAELLVTAPDSATRALVAAEIETAAAVQAATIVTATRYLPPLSTTSDRDAYCAARTGAGN